VSFFSFVDKVLDVELEWEIYYDYSRSDSRHEQETFLKVYLLIVVVIVQIDIKELTIEVPKDFYSMRVYQHKGYNND
jgi:hypothetical protein